MPLRRVLIANRGEIAIRIAHAAAARGIGSVAMFSADDAASLHRAMADAAVALPGAGAAAYLDGSAVIAAARASDCDAIHPGYGFLSEQAAFARAVRDAGLAFVGPTPEILEQFGDKVAARALAVRCGVPVARGTPGPTTPAMATAFLATLPAGRAMMIKAIAGGGGRGMRVVDDAAEVSAACERCRSEAARSFGNGDIFVEEFLSSVRHVEVQVVGDGRAVIHLHERDCTLQRRHQKLVEIAPSPWLSADLKAKLTDAAIRMASTVDYRNLGTFEFLVDADGFVFIEANPRLQVEHTVTEAVLALDLVGLQLDIAGGATLAELGLTQAEIPPPRGFAIQMRVNAERMAADGTVTPTDGTLTAFAPPLGQGVRVDTAGHVGYRPGVAFDPLLAKVIVHEARADFAATLRTARRALSEFRIEGIATNLEVLAKLLGHPDVAAGRIDTGFIAAHLGELLSAESEAEAPDTVLAPMAGSISAVEVQVGQRVRRGETLLVVEAMKMEHLIAAPAAGVVRRVTVTSGDVVSQGDKLVYLEPIASDDDDPHPVAGIDLDEIRADLALVRERHAATEDVARPDAVAKRRRANQRTARENVADLLDPGSFVEYGALAVAARRRVMAVADLIRQTPADGVVVGLGTVNGALFGVDRSRCIVLASDYTVLAGTQGQMNKRKQNRMLKLAEQWRIPVVVFAEGGGGRPGDTDRVGLVGLDTELYGQCAKLSGQVPMVGINSGRCFAGNAALLGCCDVIIATEGSNIGMGGPAMIEGGGLGVVAAKEIGPIEVQSRNGVVDIRVADEAAAVAAAKQYLGYFQGPTQDWACCDQRALRHVVPENRNRVYQIREAIQAIADECSVLELRAEFGIGMITSLIRIEGQPYGVFANNPQHLGGAIDADAADKAARFVQLCDAFDIPLLSLCDTPGFMVGPAAEKTALVRHVSRMFVTLASIETPLFMAILRKCYGLGAQGMAGGSLHGAVMAVAWPTAEFGGMGLEGAVRLGFRRELEAISDAAARKARFEELLQTYYENGRAVNIASVMEIDDVIDPADTRHRIASAFRALPAKPPRSGGKRRFVDPW